MMAILVKSTGMQPIASALLRFGIDGAGAVEGSRLTDRAKVRVDLVWRAAEAESMLISRQHLPGQKYPCIVLKCV